VHWPPGLSLRPLFSEARTVLAKTRASRVRGNAESHLEFNVIAGRQSDEAIHSSFTRAMDCFARNDGLKIGCLKIESISSSRTSEPTGRANARPMTGSASAIRDP